MNAFTLTMVATSALLVVVGMLVFVESGSGQRRLLERVSATREIKTSQSGGPNDLLIGAPVKRSVLLRVAAWLGYQADLPPRYAASMRIVVPVACTAGIMVFAFGKSLLPPAAAALGAVVVTLFVARFQFRRRSKIYSALLFRQIPDTMSLMLRAVRAGLPVAEAVRSVSVESLSPTQEEFARAAGEAALGMPLEITLRRLSERTKIQEYAFFSVVIGLHAQTGGNLSETLENLADMVRRRVAMAGKAKALSAEGRLSAILVGALPFVVGIMTTFLTPDYMQEFVRNPKGPILIGAFAVLLSLGMFISNLMVKRSTED